MHPQALFGVLFTAALVASPTAPVHAPSAKTNTTKPRVNAKPSKLTKPTLNTARCGRCSGPAKVLYVSAIETLVRAPKGGSTGKPSPKKTKPSGKATRADGSRARPFRTLEAAQKAASLGGACRVEIVVLVPNATPAGTRKRSTRARRGALEGDLNVVMHTTVRIEGPRTQRPEVRGAILNRTGCDLVLSDLRLQGGKGAVEQRGGTLRMQRVKLERVAWRGVPPSDAAVVSVSRGAVAVLNHVEFTNNELPALRLSGAGTRGHLAHVTVRDNRPPLPPGLTRDSSVVGLAALQVGESARLYAEHLDLRNNRCVGIYVHAKAAAHLRHVDLRSTSGVPAGVDTLGGTNLMVTGSGSKLHVSDFESTDADLAGLGVFGGARIKARDGSLRNNTVGLAADQLNEACFDRVETLNNVSNVDTRDVTIPGAAGVLDAIRGDEATASSASCASVPWRNSPS